MNLSNFFFPVTERRVFVDNGIGSIIDTENPATYLMPKHKAIVREDTNEFISIVSEDYRLVTNQELITKITDSLDKYNFDWEIDKRHSFVNNGRMKLALVFPSITFNDGRSDVALSCYIHNSYNYTEGIRIMLGFIRYICTNGAIVGKLLGKYYHRHTNGVNLGDVAETMTHAVKNMDKLEERIKELKNTKVEMNDNTVEELKEIYGPEMTNNIVETIYHHKITAEQLNMYLLMNVITYLISHHIHVNRRTFYQMKVAKHFGL